jgi:hypothetical protein
MYSSCIFGSNMLLTPLPLRFCLFVPFDRDLLLLSICELIQAKDHMSVNSPIATRALAIVAL